jgi:c-di-GMP-binding flagellar brake protein YcgR
MADKDQEFLRQAIARNTGVVLSLPSAGMLRHHKSRFIRGNEQGILIEAPQGEYILIDQLIAESKPVGISFKLGSNKVMFAGAILQTVKNATLNDDTTLDALLIPWPQDLKSLQRRADYRVDIPGSCPITINVWRIGEKANCRALPLTNQEVKAELRNLSTGGAGVRLVGQDDRPPKISTEDRLRVQIGFRENLLILEGRMRNPAAAPTDNVVFTGIQFKKLEDDLEGRRTIAQLTRIVGELQREELRRMRVGLTLSA